VVSFTPWPRFLRVNGPRYPLYRGISGPQSVSGHIEQINTSISCPCQELNPGSSVVQSVACSLVAIRTELSRQPVSLYCHVYGGTRDDNDGF
jgi:hypothetical protein